MSTDGATVPVAVLRKLMGLLTEYAERFGELAGEIAGLRQGLGTMADAAEANAAALAVLRDEVRRLRDAHMAPVPVPAPGLLARTSHLALDVATAGLGTRPGQAAAGTLIVVVVAILAAWFDVAVPMIHLLSPESADARP